MWRFWKRSQWPKLGKDAVGVWPAQDDTEDDERARSEPPKRRGGGASGVREPRQPTPSSGGETTS